MKLALLAAGMTIALMASAPASARPTQVFHSATLWNVNDRHVGTSKPELRAQMAHSAYVIDHYRQSDQRWKLFPRHSTCWSVGSPKLAHLCDFARQHLAAQEWLHDLAQSRYRRLYAPKPAAPIVTTSWLYNAFLCIHHYEGAWNDDTGNGYYGGLQFDAASWWKYGSQYASQANYATPAEQIAAGIAYYHDAGFAPWPNTAAMCGL